MTDNFDINNQISLNELDDNSKEYFFVHEKRYNYLLKIVEQIRSKIINEKINILDVGPSLLTILLNKNFPSDKILSLGLDSEKSRGGHLPSHIQLDKEHFFNYNLNDAQFREKWIDLPAIDIIIMAEVIEHLYTSPVVVLNFLNSFLNKGGYLIIQTPNAASLRNRLVLLLGKNPYEMIRENSENPGHFHEYTISELINVAEKTGFTLISWECKSYFNPRNLIEKIYIKVTDFLPKTFRNGITIILKKE